MDQLWNKLNYFSVCVNIDWIYYLGITKYGDYDLIVIISLCLLSLHMVQRMYKMSYNHPYFFRPYFTFMITFKLASSYTLQLTHITPMNPIQHYIFDKLRLTILLKQSSNSSVYFSCTSDFSKITYIVDIERTSARMQWVNYDCLLLAAHDDCSPYFR